VLPEKNWFYRGYAFLTHRGGPTTENLGQTLRKNEAMSRQFKGQVEYMLLLKNTLGNG
jgi:hypothetical protein